MAVNKVVYGDETLVDMTDATATADDLMEGVTAYAANGEKISGVLKGIMVDGELSDTSTNPVQNKVVKAALDGMKTLPDGGTVGQVLGKTEDGEAWVDAPTGGGCNCPEDLFGLSDTLSIAPADFFTEGVPDIAKIADKYPVYVYDADNGVLLCKVSDKQMTDSDFENGLVQLMHADGATFATFISKDEAISSKMQIANGVTSYCDFIFFVQNAGDVDAGDGLVVSFPEAGTYAFLGLFLEVTDLKLDLILPGIGWVQASKINKEYVPSATIQVQGNALFFSGVLTNGVAEVDGFLKPGKEYTATIDGVTYTGVCKITSFVQDGNTMAVFYVGNMGMFDDDFQDSGESFGLCTKSDVKTGQIVLSVVTTTNGNAVGATEVTVTCNGGGEYQIPAFTAEDNGKVLGLTGKGVEWVDPDVFPDFTEADNGKVLTVGESGLAWAFPVVVLYTDQTYLYTDAGNTTKLTAAELVGIIDSRKTIQIIFAAGNNVSAVYPVSSACYGGVGRVSGILNGNTVSTFYTAEYVAPTTAAE